MLVRAHLTPLAIALCSSIALATLLVYFRTVHYDFVFYDDDLFVYDNPVMKAGLSWSSVVWSFGRHFANWHPLTWISYLLNVQWFGMNAGAFHMGNVLLHAASAALLFLALFRMTGKPWRCAVVTAVFALHPLHVESVAWVAERKDVLSTFFEMVALLLYVRYAERPNALRYLLVFLAFAASLMAKPMSVTFPFVLLLVDYWPLRRIQLPLRWAEDRRVAMEKVPLLLISLAASALTVVAQREFGTVASLSGMPMPTRILNSAIAYVVYIKEAIWPLRLGVLYPSVPPSGRLGGVCLLMLAVATVAVVRFGRQRSYLFTGWFWYLGMLVPVIGLVQVGVQSRADRYMYLPLVGLTIAIVWGVAEWLEHHSAYRRPVAAAAAGVLLFFAIGTWRQVSYWKDSRTLFEHTLAVTDDNYIIENNLGVVLARSGDSWGARYHWLRAMQIDPKFPLAPGNLGEALLNLGLRDGARSLLEKAIQLKPDFQSAQRNLGIIDASTGNFPDSIEHLSEALRLNADDAVAHSNLCYALEHVGRLGEALDHCRAALRLKPDYPDAQYNVKNVLAELH